MKMTNEQDARGHRSGKNLARKAEHTSRLTGKKGVESTHSTPASSMMTVRHASDTSADAAAVQMTLIRQTPPSKRLERALSLSGELIRLSKAAIRRRYPDFSEDDVGLKFIELNYGSELAQSVRAWRFGVGD